MSRAGTLRTEICGVHFDMLDMSDVVRHIIAERDRGSGGWVTTPNVDIVRQVTGDPELAQLVAGAPLVILDGAPVSWAGRIAGRPPVPRVPGPRWSSRCRALPRRPVPPSCSSEVDPEHPSALRRGWRRRSRVCGSPTTARRTGSTRTSSSGPESSPPGRSARGGSSSAASASPSRSG